MITLAAARRRSNRSRAPRHRAGRSAAAVGEAHFGVEAEAATRAALGQLDAVRPIGDAPAVLASVVADRVRADHEPQLHERDGGDVLDARDHGHAHGQDAPVWRRGVGDVAGERELTAERPLALDVDDEPELAL